jgi:hypothetical protein
VSSVKETGLSDRIFFGGGTVNHSIANPDNVTVFAQISPNG